MRFPRTLFSLKPDDIIKGWLLNHLDLIGKEKIKRTEFTGEKNCACFRKLSSKNNVSQ